MISSTAFMLLGLAILLVSSSLVYAFGRGYGIRKEGFLLSFRNLGPLLTAISIGMAWAGSPAFFIASGQAFNTGLVGLFWFSIGNILTLMVFAFAAQKIRQAVPEGYNLSDFIREQYGKLASKVFTCAALIINYVTMCITMVAVVFFVNALSGIDKIWISLAVIGIALTLSFRTGFRATVITEVIKFALVVLGLGSIVAMLAFNPDIKSFTEGLGGVKGTGADIFGTANAWTVFATFGVITFFSQMSAPWADNNYSQRAFAFGGAFSQPIYDPEILVVEHKSFEEYKNKKTTSVNHFYEKLLLLKDRMNTETGKKIALKRHQLMEQYLQNFFHEWESNFSSECLTTSIT